MSIIQFSHANGFPAKTYSVLFEHLKDHTISAIDNLAENRVPPAINWHDLTEDVLESVGKFKRTGNWRRSFVGRYAYFTGDC